MILMSSLSTYSLASTAAETDTAQTTPRKKENELEEVVVTGSLIPQLRTETARPVMVITADDIKAKGFSSVAEALQHSSFATGNVQNPQEPNQFTPGAQTVKFFGLSASYTKYLIDGRPIADYPALYNGSDIIASLSGIPPCSLSPSMYFPGANLRSTAQTPLPGWSTSTSGRRWTVRKPMFRYGWTKDGGGTERRIALADGFSFGGVNVLVGGQYERTDPSGAINVVDRPIPSEWIIPADRGTRLADLWIVGQDNGNTYYMLDPALCGNVASQVGNTVGLRTRGTRGQYCGTFSTGYNTIGNGNRIHEVYAHLSDDINDNIQVFSDVLLDH